ncbi:cysteine dioxygenase [Priestia filamentosa]|uniref:cysteine dioxygenase n=1 Tax=Priestia filamentosa TaxID=1402861 RepID=UPI0002E6384B|nr:cysteine dioxygenase family protein [Priestia filamentosa]
MTLIEQAKHILDELNSPTRFELRKALLALDINFDELKPLLQSAEDKPYYRKLLYQNDEVELLVMNWSGIECAPHDHGHSYGWIQVVNGTTINTVYEVKENQLPEELFSQYQEEGKIFFAPQKGVHKMNSAGGTNLVTLHLYAPPIKGMMVYDLEACAACVVSDDCGAWWPDHLSQKVKEIQLKKRE